MPATGFRTGKKEKINFNVWHDVFDKEKEKDKFAPEKFIPDGRTMEQFERWYGQGKSWHLFFPFKKPNIFQISSIIVL